ncbi:MAG TPA: 5'-nucleotidase, lipoprotein e(P4) family [Bacteroidales bacterium]|nr:5'-nucleotidase, lipoprotein e(P4) family [Bacteroidales bacterium]
MKKYFLIPLLLLGACSVKFSDDTVKEEPVSDHALTMATLYQYYAEEYKAMAYQAFNIARERIDEMIADNMVPEKLAIVVDIDETLLDNSPSEAILIERDTSYPYMWKEWCEMAVAKAVPGAVEFLQYADKKGFNIFYISNRKKKNEQAPSMKNLMELGFPQIDEEHFLLKIDRSEQNPDPSDKQSRRDEVGARGFEIVMLIGDNLGDFYTDEMGTEARTGQLESYKEEFGKRFIILPNAMYGNWQKSLGIRDAETMDSLIRNMTSAFNQ